jgi:hypothetical protein
MRDDDDEAEGRDVRGGILPDSIRKALVSGISALFMTEEGIRNMLSDMRLPKDAMAYLVQQTERTRKELFRVVSQELKGFLKSADLTREVRKALLGMKVQVRAEVRFVEDGPKTDFEASVHDGRAASTPTTGNASGNATADAPPRKKRTRRG